ncbi:unnamed protein product [Allacma fusca]|uniref:Uncharacterized protein n=1 Tax=Allacma fusca TaxID=39272 RepID=A0A8J2KRV0_9HEXA|nr:unnamed protein product [Allacma fusca]
MASNFLLKLALLILVATAVVAAPASQENVTENLEQTTEGNTDYLTSEESSRELTDDEEALLESMMRNYVGARFFVPTGPRYGHRYPGGFRRYGSGWNRYSPYFYRRPYYRPSPFFW